MGPYKVECNFDHTTSFQPYNPISINIRPAIQTEEVLWTISNEYRDCRAKIERSNIMSTKSAQSPLPILIVVGLAGMSLVQLIAPGLVPPGATLLLLGVVFLLLYAINWIRDPVTLITGWVLAGFGISSWITTLDTFADLGGAVLLFGLAIAFFGIYFSMGSKVVIESRKWPLLLGSLLLLMGLLFVLEGIVGREKLWSVIVPLIPTAVAIWYIVEWRRTVEALEAD
jgi:hypothetical protein